MTTDTATKTTVEHEVETKPDFGNGRYSNLMSEVYSNAMVIFKLNSAQAEKLARNVAREVGAVMALCPVEVKAGKPNKDSRLTLSEAAKVKNVGMTNEITALRALQYANEAGKNGFSWRGTDWQPVNFLAEYLAKL